MSETQRVHSQVPIDVILDNLALSICCDEPDGEEFRQETRYWLEQLMLYIQEPR